MPLRLTTKDRTYKVPIKVAGDDVVFELRNICIDDKQKLLTEISQLPETETAFSSVLDLLAEYIVSIDGHDESPRKVLGQMEHFADLMEIATGVIRFATVDPVDAANLDVPLVPSTPVSAATATAPTEKDHA